MLRALVAACLAAPLAFATAAAQDWPSRTINVIVPLGAGSASDIVARVVMEQVGRQLGQSAVVENRPGAGGTIGANWSRRRHPTVTRSSSTARSRARMRCTRSFPTTR